MDLRQGCNLLHGRLIKRLIHSQKRYRLAVFGRSSKGKCRDIHT